MLATLFSQADILLHGSRNGELDALGVTQAWRNEQAPDQIEVSLSAYGWSGPWATRRGFDSLVQMSCGIADAGMIHYGNLLPTPLPVQALDHATGYLMAAAAIKALYARFVTRPVSSARLSLARTAELLIAHPQDQTGSLMEAVNEKDFYPIVENMYWGKALRLRPPLQLGSIKMNWSSPATELGSSRAQWQDAHSN